MPLTPRRDDDEHPESSPGALMEEEEEWGKWGWRFVRGEKTVQFGVARFRK